MLNLLKEMAWAKRCRRSLHNFKPQILVEHVGGMQSHLDYKVPVRKHDSCGEFYSKGEQRNEVVGGEGCGIKQWLF